MHGQPNINDFSKLLFMKFFFVMYPVAIGTCSRSMIIRMWNFETFGSGKWSERYLYSGVP